MDRRELVLAALAPAEGEPHSPAQVQKLMFLIDKEIPELVDGPHFNFIPYDYGPFDSEVYAELERLWVNDLVEITPKRNWRTYRLTDEGQEEAEKIFKKLDKKAQKYVKKLSDFLHTLSFSQLIRAIYKAYPEMSENSVFRG